MKIKKITYGELKKRFGGLRSLAFNRTDGILMFKRDFMPIEYGVCICYKRKKDCTYVTLTCLGHFHLFEPENDKLTIVCKFEGRVTTDDLTSSDFAYKKELEAVMEELYNDWKSNLENKD